MLQFKRINFEQYQGIPYMKLDEMSYWVGLKIKLKQDLEDLWISLQKSCLIDCINQETSLLVSLKCKLEREEEVLMIWLIDG